MNDYRDEKMRFTNNERQAIDRLGVKSINKHGSEATVIEYNNSSDITIKFDNGYIVKTGWRTFYQNKEFVSPLCKTVCRIGYMGIGSYSHSHKGKNMWIQMIHRVYSEKKLKKKPTYRKVSVCEEWHNFQNFAKWYDENYYEIEGEMMCLDKDILIKGNKIYSPEVCCIVPSRINAVFVKGDDMRGNYPIGVSKRGDTGKFRISFTKSISNNEKIKPKRFNYGQCNTPEEAFKIYKIEKEKYIKEVADYYKDKIPKVLYCAMYDYKVEITD